jgi:hypothetical protein
VTWLYGVRSLNARRRAGAGALVRGPRAGRSPLEKREPSSEAEPARGGREPSSEVDLLEEVCLAGPLQWAAGATVAWVVPCVRV